MLYGINKVLPKLVGKNNRKCLRILIYHQVLERKDYLKPGDPTAVEFDWQMQLLRRYFVPLSLQTALMHLEQGTLPENAVCVTFDDGYADNLTQALPILEKWHIPATIFIATGFLNGGRMWNDTIIESIRSTSDNAWDLDKLGLGVLDLSSEIKRKAAANQLLQAIKHLPFDERASATEYISSLAAELPNDLMLTDNQVHQLKSHGIEIGAHTCNHPILTKLPIEAAHKEILEGRTYLQNLLNTEIPFFAYPNGKSGLDYDQSHADLVKELGFSAAVTTNHGVISATSNRFQLPRFTPWDKTPLKFYTRLILNHS